MMRAESLLQGMKTAQAFDSEHLTVLRLKREAITTLYRLAIDDDRAGSALRGVATLVRTGQSAALAKRLEQTLITRHLALPGSAVDEKTNLRIAHPGPPALRGI